MTWSSSAWTLAWISGRFAISNRNQLTVCAEVSVPAISRSMHSRRVMVSVISPDSSWASITSTIQVGADKSNPGRLRAASIRALMTDEATSDWRTASLTPLLGRKRSQGM